MARWGIMKNIFKWCLNTWGKCSWVRMENKRYPGTGLLSQNSSYRRLHSGCCILALIFSFERRVSNPLLQEFWRQTWSPALRTGSRREPHQEMWGRISAHTQHSRGPTELAPRKECHTQGQMKKWCEGLSTRLCSADLLALRPPHRCQCDHFDLPSCHLKFKQKDSKNVWSPGSRGRYPGKQSEPSNEHLSEYLGFGRGVTLASDDGQVT